MEGTGAGNRGRSEAIWIGLWKMIKNLPYIVGGSWMGSSERKFKEETRAWAKDWRQSSLWDPEETARDKKKSSGELGSYMCQDSDWDSCHPTFDNFRENKKIHMCYQVIMENTPFYLLLGNIQESNHYTEKMWNWTIFLGWVEISHGVVFA